MKRYSLLLGFSTMLLICGASLSQDPSSTRPYDAGVVVADLSSALENRVGVARNAVGIVLGVTTPEGRRYLAEGLATREGGSELNSDTMFEIGSVTKVFTALLLAQMVVNGEVSLDDPVSMYLPESVTVPSRNGIPITLVDLATHTSGLPRSPTNLAPEDPRNRYADYSRDDLYQFLSGYQLAQDPGERWGMSNVGMALLGHALERRAGVPYEELLKSRVLTPLGMTDTTISVSDDQRSRMATGYNGLMRENPKWSWQVLAPQGALVSTAEDMLTFAEAWLNDDVFESEKALMLSVSHEYGDVFQQHMGWAGYRETVLFHEGVTDGFMATLAINPTEGRAAVVLSNSTQVPVNELALHSMLPGDWPLTAFEAYRDRTEIELSQAVLEQYVGEYELSPGNSVAITRSDGSLFWQTGGSPSFELAAESASVFFDKENPAVLTIEFLLTDNGDVSALQYNYNGSTGTASRVVMAAIESAPPFQIRPIGGSKSILVVEAQELHDVSGCTLVAAISVSDGRIDGDRRHYQGTEERARLLLRNEARSNDADTVLIRDISSVSVGGQSAGSRITISADGFQCG